MSRPAKDASGAAFVAFVAFVLGAAGVAWVVAAPAQELDVGRPRKLVVGTPGGARAVRIDSARSGASRDPLPQGGLRVQWQTPTGALLDETPVVDASGTAYVVGTRGEVVAIARNGSERWRVSTGAVQPGPAALLSDDTLVFADALGEAVAVRNGAVRWRVRFGRGDVSHPAPLPLEDGGVIVATAHDLAALDIDGHERARTTLPEAATGPLLAWSDRGRGKILAIGGSGTVWGWTPGAAREPDRAGSFGGPVEGGAVLADARTLVAVTAGGAQLLGLDLVSGTVAPRAQAPASAGLWLGPPATRGGNLYLTLLAPTAELVVALDAGGNETLRARVASRTPPISVDGGAAPLVAMAHAAPLVDAAGTLAFASTDGTFGTATTAANGTVELLAGICSGARIATTASDAARITGIAPIGSGVIVAACRAGMLVAIAGAGTAGGGGSGHL